MIRRSDEFRLEHRPIANGTGDLTFHHKFAPEEMFGKCRLCSEITLAPGDSVGEHAHTGEFEFYYLLRGELVSIAEDGGETPFRAGDMMLTGGGESHSVRNDSGQPATLLAIIVN